MPSVAWVVQFDATEQIARELPNEAAKILRYGANLARKKARERLRASTRVWLRGKGDRLYEAAAPGQPPARVTGELVRAARVRKQSRLTFTFDFGTGKHGMDHVARILEGGSARVAARPFFGQSVEEAAAATERELAELLEVDVNATTGKVTWKKLGSNTYGILDEGGDE